MDHRFSLQTQIQMGGQDVPSLVAVYRRVYIVTDRFLHENGKTAYITTHLDACGSEYRIFDRVKPDPDIDTLIEGIIEILDYKPDVLIALGGGSPIDAGKAMRFFAEKAGRTAPLPLIAIPTTSGTGSEVSRFAVITDPVHKLKYPLVDDSLMPQLAILDAELVMSVPPPITADTGMDVLSHALEAYVSTRANDFSDAAAEKAFELVHEFLLQAFSHPEDRHARQRMHHASCLAGVAFSNAGLGLTHSMAHALGGSFKLPHGRANAILLPYVMSFNSGCVDGLTPTAKRFAQLSRTVGLEAGNTRQSALNLIHLARQYQKRMGLPTSIRLAGISAGDFDAALPQLVEGALEDRCTETNPRPVDADALTIIFRRAYLGKIP